MLAASNLSGVDEWVWRLPLLIGAAECTGASVSRMTAQMNLGDLDAMRLVNFWRHVGLAQFLFDLRDFDCNLLSRGNFSLAQHRAINRIPGTTVAATITVRCHLGCCDRRKVEIAPKCAKKRLEILSGGELTSGINACMSWPGKFLG